MMKGETKSRASGQIEIIDAYIIDELNEKNHELAIEMPPAHLPSPAYEQDIDEAVADNQQCVIIIEF